jgi:hypothetical protein
MGLASIIISIIILTMLIVAVSMIKAFGKTVEAGGNVSSLSLKEKPDNKKGEGLTLHFTFF